MNKKLELKYVNPSDLKPYIGNPRNNEHAVEPVKKSIEYFGFINPIIVRKTDNMIVAGHTRWKAALKDNLKEIPVIYVDFSENDAKLYNLADNKLGEFALWDVQGLDMLLQDLKNLEIDISIAGFDDLINQEINIEEKTLKPYKNTHVLLSFPPEKLIEIQDYLEKIIEIAGIEYEQSSN